VLTYSPDRQTPSLSRSYFQLFRDGKVEGVDSILLGAKEPGRIIPSLPVEAACINFIQRIFQLYRVLKTEPPAAVMITLLGVKSYYMSFDPLSGSESSQIDRDAVMLTPAIADSYEVNVAAFLRRTFDELWNAAGLSRCEDYDGAGQPVGALQNAIRSAD
jgi:hypothetical protein